ncbi:MAG TPA: tetratricopeptide repeat protein [Acidobacteriaceae bacterium]|jgi:tetratricopeptide (TPR) repeat protein
MRVSPVLIIPFFLSLHLLALTPESRTDVLHDLQQGRADHALEVLQSDAAENRTDADAQQLLCRLSLQLERWNDAVAACEKAVALNPDSSNNHLWYGRALGEKAERASFIKAYGLAKRVKAEFETAVALDPHNAEALSDLGEYYTEAPAIVGGGKDKAAAIASRLDDIDRARAEELRGQIAASNKDTAAAEQHFREAIADSPHPANYWMVLASFYQKQNDLLRMQQAIRSGLEADGARGEPLVDAAHLLTRADQDPQTAIRLLRQYLASPDKSEEEPAFRVHLMLASLLDKQGDAAGAAQEIQASAAIASVYHPTKQVATNTGR